MTTNRHLASCAVASTRRDFMKQGTLAAFSTFCLPFAALRSLEARAEEEGNDVVLRCCVMSDVHFNGSPDAPEVERLKRAINYMYEYSEKQKYQNFDALVVVGDMTNHGIDKELSLYKKTVDEAIRPGTFKMHCMGNHEHYGGSQAFWKETLGLEPNAHYVFNGYHFITIAPKTGENKDGDYMYAIDWLEEQIKNACEDANDKPVFVCQHHPVDPTVYGGRGYDNWGIKDLYELLQRYPRVVNFSGHTHCPINDPRCAWQGRFTAFGTGTLSYLCHGAEGGKYNTYPSDNHTCGQFYILEVRRDHSFILKLFDLVSMSFYDVVYYVAKAGDVDHYVYTDERYKTSAKPVWPENAKVEVDEIYEYGAFCEFQQAKCDRTAITPDGVPNAPVFPHSYAVRLERLEKENQWQEVPTQYFWAQYFNLPTPERLRVELTNLEPDAQYRAKVYATNHFLRDSDSALEFAFKTKSELDENVDRTAPRPSPDVLALAAVGGAFVNQPVNSFKRQRSVEPLGAPKIVQEPKLDGREVVQFNGKGDCYKIQCDARTYRKLRKPTIRAVFMADGARTEGSASVFGNTEARGLEITVDYEKRVVTLWAYVAGGYKTAEAPVEFDRYVDACGTYDGEVLVLYLDGKEVARTAVKGVVEHPNHELVQAFFVAADVSPTGRGTAFFTGRIACAQLYSWALKAEQVANLANEK